jgi:hypothetical protein
MSMSRVLAVVATLAMTGACAAESESDGPLTWEEFQAQAHREPDTGVWIINGDEPAPTAEHLYEYYRAYLADHSAAQGLGVAESNLIVNTLAGGAIDKWPAGQAQNLTYCVSKKAFGSRYNAVVQAMADATAAWEGAANVNFVHVAALDGNCNARQTGVVFDVGYVCRGSYIARAFFPSYARRDRNVLIDCSAWGNIAPWTLTGVLRHELGHTLGFRHEHTRPEAGTCFENNAWSALTAYDSDSVMHYPHCNGTQSGDLVLTALDRAGAAALYPY